jgi:hypothetical protein
VALLLEGADVLIELSENCTDVFKIVLFESLELLDGSKEFNELGDSAAEEVKLSEDLVG